MMRAPLRAAAACLFALSAACTSKSSDNGAAQAASNYCTTLNNYINRCNFTDACSLAVSKNCAQYAGSLSSAALAAVGECDPGATCGSDAGSSNVGACITAKEIASGPSGAQQKLAQDYCGSCAFAFSLTAANCESSFYAGATTGAPLDGGGTAVTSGEVGAVVLGLSDTIVSDIDTSCAQKMTATVDGCTNTFAGCIGITVDFDAPSSSACNSTSTTSSTAPFSMRRALHH